MCNRDFRRLHYVDPTGHSWKKFWKAAAIVVVGVALTIATGGAMAAMGFAAGGFWSSVAVGAVMGGTIGGATSAALGGNIGQGMLTGAITGAIFGGIGSWAQTNQIGNSMRAFAHGIGGSVSGGVNSAITGGNIGQGALIGGISAGMSARFGGSNILTRAAFGGLMGGSTSAATGGDFWSGARQGAVTSAIASVVNDSAHPGVVEEPGLQPCLGPIDYLIAGVVGVPAAVMRVASVLTTVNSPSPITGYTKHGLNQAISRDGHGVSVESIYGAVKNPVEIRQNSNGTTSYIGENATVILNDQGKVVTTWGKPRY